MTESRDGILARAGLRPAPRWVPVVGHEACQLPECRWRFAEGGPDLFEHLPLHHGYEGIEELMRIVRKQSAEISESSMRAFCQCCYYGNHEFRCTCAAASCCHPGHHENGQPLGLTSAELFEKVSAALADAHNIEPCSCGQKDWTCVHPGATPYEDRRAAAVMEIVHTELRLRDQEIARLRAVAPKESQ